MHFIDLNQLHLLSTNKYCSAKLDIDAITIAYSQQKSGIVAWSGVYTIVMNKPNIKRH